MKANEQKEAALGLSFFFDINNFLMIAKPLILAGLLKLPGALAAVRADTSLPRPSLVILA